jgi:hypothetical protein
MPVPVRQGDDRFVGIAAELANDFAARAAEHDRDNTFVAENFESLQHARYTALAVPTELGGLGASLRQICYAQAVLARGCGSTALAVNMHVFLTLVNTYRWKHGGVRRRSQREPRQRSFLGSYGYANQSQKTTSSNSEIDTAGTEGGPGLMGEPELEGALAEATQRVLDQRQADLSNALGRVERAWFASDLAAALRQQGVTIAVRLDGNEPDLQIATQSGTEQAVVDIRTVPTNFGRSRRGVSGTGITNSIDSVCSDVTKLKHGVQHSISAYVLWLAYPIPDDDRARDLWITQVAKVRKHSPGTCRVASTRLSSDVGYAYAYLSPA